MSFHVRKKWETDRHTDSQTDRQTDRQTDGANHSIVAHFVRGNYNKVKVNEVSQHRHLGLTLETCLNWKAHIDYITAKASCCLGFLQCFKYKLSRKTLDYLYKSYILSILN